RRFQVSVEKATHLLATHADSGALATLGKWYAFRAANDWAVETLEKARAAGAEVSPLMLARCHWALHRHSDALREFKEALSRSEAPVQDLQICIAAVSRAADGKSRGSTGSP